MPISLVVPRFAAIVFAIVTIAICIIVRKKFEKHLPDFKAIDGFDKCPVCMVSSAFMSLVSQIAPVFAWKAMIEAQQNQIVFLIFFSWFLAVSVLVFPLRYILDYRKWYR